MRCNQVWVYTYLRGNEKKVNKETKQMGKKNFVRYDEDAAAVLGEKAGTWTLGQLPHWPTGHYQAQMGSQVRGQGLVRYGGDFLALPPMAGENTESPALRLSSLSFMCSQDFNCKEDKKKKATPLLWVCYPSKDTRPLSLWFAVRIELFFFLKGKKRKLILPQKTFKELFWIYLEMTPVYIACKFILEYIIIKNYKW